ncbi:MAG: M14 metallopeptidase family protein [bacterium]
MNTFRQKLILSVLDLLFGILQIGTGFGQVTPPEQFLGYKPGADFHLATYEQLQEYFDLIDSQTDRLKMFDMGPTAEGRRMRYAVIASDETMTDLDHYRLLNRRLSFVRGLTEDEAQRLSKEGKVVVWIDSGIHASETSPPMHQFQLAYDLVTGTDERTLRIRDNTILLLVQANPDGMTLVADWYHKHLGTQFEVSSLPFLYHKYAGHDNNRDFHVANLVETQNMNRIMGSVWCPDLAYAQHETAPFPARIWLPPNADPVNPNTHPAIFRWKNLIGVAMGQAFDAADQPGALSRIGFDLWYPGYEGGPNLEAHNIPFVMTETANYRYATPHYYTVRDFPEAYRDLTPGTFYPSPWEGGWWRFADAVAYDLTASKAVLDVAARYRSDFLYMKYK